MILGGLTIIAFYCIGEWIQQQLALPVPGSVIGMMLMLTYLMYRKGVSIGLHKASHTLIFHLTLFLIPSCVGLITCIDILKHQGLLIVTTIVLSILTSIIITSWILGVFKQSIDSTADQCAVRQPIDRS